MAASDYISVEVLVETTVGRVKKKTPTTYLVPKSTLIEAIGAKLDADSGVGDTNYASTVSDGQ